ncbi:MAG: hypothetical protein LRY71_17865 [Bacillaceae bacterium]|nr:hypothetical protein [Bacillaceae bacterium]
MNNTAVNVFENKTRLKIVESTDKGKGELGFPPLYYYLQEGFQLDIRKMQKEETKTLSLGLSNLDFAFSGGLQTGVHLIGGKPGDERMSFIVHLLAHFAKQKYACIYLSEREDKASLLLKLLIRNNFIQERNTPLQANQLVEKLTNEPQFLETSLEQISSIVKFISIENISLDDLTHLKNRMTYQTQKCERSVFVIDVEDAYALDAKGMIDRLMTIADELQVHIIVSFDLSENDFNNAKNGYVTTTKIESAVDSFILFSRSNTPEVSTTFDGNSPNELQVMIRNSKPFTMLTKTVLTYYPQSFYFQDA